MTDSVSKSGVFLVAEAVWYRLLNSTSSSTGPCATSRPRCRRWMVRPRRPTRCTDQRIYLPPPLLAPQLDWRPDWRPSDPDWPSQAPDWWPRPGLATAACCTLRQVSGSAPSDEQSAQRRSDLRPRRGPSRVALQGPRSDSHRPGTVRRRSVQVKGTRWSERAHTAPGPFGSGGMRAAAHRAAPHLSRTVLRRRALRLCQLWSTLEGNC